MSTFLFIRACTHAISAAKIRRIAPSYKFYNIFWQNHFLNPPNPGKALSKTHTSHAPHKHVLHPIHARFTGVRHIILHDVVSRSISNLLLAFISLLLHKIVLFLRFHIRQNVPMCDLNIVCKKFSPFFTCLFAKIPIFAATLVITRSNETN